MEQGGALEQVGARMKRVMGLTPKVSRPLKAGRLERKVRTMTFDEYHQHRRAAKWFKPADEAGMREFEAAQPEKCPRCGVQVFDPFARRIVIHDVEKCRSTNGQGKRPAECGSA